VIFSLSLQILFKININTYKRK